MIRCNLIILLAERGLKITKVSKDTGISRTTLTSLANNYSQGIQFNTLNTLCLYLRVSPEQLVSHVPVDIEIQSISLPDRNLEIVLLITSKGKTRECLICGTVDSNFTNGELSSIEISISLWDADDNPECIEENNHILNAFHLLTLPFLKDMENSFCNIIIAMVDPKGTLPVDISFEWCSGLNSL